MTIIYGVDTDKPFTGAEVREAIIQCFQSAHQEALHDEKLIKSLSAEELTKMKSITAKQLIGDLIKQAGGDFDHPTKDVLMTVCVSLASFVKNFREPGIIGKHFSEISNLIGKLDK